VKAQLTDSTAQQTVEKEYLTIEDARRTLEAAGWFTGREVQL